MPVKGIKEVKANFNKLFTDIHHKKAVQFTNVVLSIGQSHSRELAPVEFSTLINSTIKDVDVTSSGVRGSFSYNTVYAARLEFREDWKPRPPEQKQGPAWNPNAKPHYLERGFEDAESQASIRRAIKIFKV